MIQPYELKLKLPMEVGSAVISTTSKVWEMLAASNNGDLKKMQSLLKDCSELIYAQYNYTPPVYFAVRGGHTEIVKFLLNEGAYDVDYLFYPFRENLQTVAADRGFREIEDMLAQYIEDTNKHSYKGDTGQIFYNRSKEQTEFEEAVGKSDLEKTAAMLKQNPDFATDRTFFWSEGILTFAAKENNRPLVDLLMGFGAKVPSLLKWAPSYYFERLDGATYMMEKGMNPNTQSWQHVSILHNMAQKGFIDKADLLLRYGADINPVDEAYQSTPLGLAARWGQTAMVKYLISKGADVNKAGAPWATPLLWAKKKGHEETAAVLIKAGAR